MYIVEHIQLMQRWLQKKFEHTFIFNYRIDQYLGKLSDEIDDVLEGRLPQYYRQYNLAHVVYGIVWHFYLAIDSSITPHLRFLGVDFFYLSSGSNSLWLIQLVFGMIYIPLILYYYVVFWRNPREYQMYSQYVLSKYYPKRTTPPMPSLMKKQKQFAATLLAIVSVARLGTAFAPLLFLARNWSLIVPDGQPPVWHILVRDILVVAINYHSHFIRVNLMVYIFMSTIMNMILYDSIIRLKFKELNTLLTGRTRSLTHSIRRYMICFFDMLRFMRNYDDIFGRLYCWFAFGITPMSVLAILALATSDAQSLMTSQLFYAIYYGAAIGCFIPQLMFSNYSTLFHKRYHRFSSAHQQLSRRVGLPFQWKTLRMIESLGGRPLGMTYIYMNMTITSNTLYKFLLIYFQMFIIFYSSMEGY